jgi:hypothetical protein
MKRPPKRVARAPRAVSVPTKARATVIRQSYNFLWGPATYASPPSAPPIARKDTSQGDRRDR